MSRFSRCDTRSAAQEVPPAPERQHQTEHMRRGYDVGALLLLIYEAMRHSDVQSECRFA